jgi:hypothetical protein
MKKYAGKSQLDEGLGGRAGMGGGGGGGKSGPSGRMSKATKAEIKKLRDEAIKGNVKRDIKISKSAPERKEAVKKATTEVKDGVKVTKYPYVEPSAKRQKYRSLDDTLQDLDDVGFKKGGKVKCMARGGGIEVRGKTKCKYR